jgi:hypothetical protein
MTKPHKPQSVANAAASQTIAKPARYVDVNDLRTLLKLALGLHAAGDPKTRLTKAADGLARIANADAWVVRVLVEREAPAVDGPQSRLYGGTDAQAAVNVAKQIDAEMGLPGTSIGKLIAARPTRGRVLAVIDSKASAIYSVLREEKQDGERPRMTWISVHRNATAPPFVERERRMVELFHSQSAWIILRMDT